MNRTKKYENWKTEDWNNLPRFRLCSSTRERTLSRYLALIICSRCCSNLDARSSPCCMLSKSMRSLSTVMAGKRRNPIRRPKSAKSSIWKKTFEKIRPKISKQRMFQVESFEPVSHAEPERLQVLKYDQLGRCVQTFGERHRTAGEFCHQWNDRLVTARLVSECGIASVARSNIDINK
ncbi:unnamed protein product [Nesidiocoris tenuis]|uniref:Uncharacterized protein n=1 Tax=Nesidiocoris tenuis TaxID=355587 RepID=A0A6H5HQZ8_9HEMI|nr:unnamed protein product [Nesidiocoris tenuis]